MIRSIDTRQQTMTAEGFYVTSFVMVDQNYPEGSLRCDRGHFSPMRLHVRKGAPVEYRCQSCNGVGFVFTKDSIEPLRSL